MTLRQMARDVWTVMAPVDHRGRCRVRESMARLEADRPGELARLVALLDRVAAEGPPRNEARSRRVAPGIYEFKTRGAIRVPYFMDKGHIIICTDVVAKPKRTELREVVLRAQRTREAYLRAKRLGSLEITEEDP